MLCIFARPDPVTPMRWNKSNLILSLGFILWPCFAFAGGGEEVVDCSGGLPSGVSAFFLTMFGIALLIALVSGLQLLWMEASGSRRVRFRVATLASMITSLVLGFIGTFAGSPFPNVFDSFGNLPGATQFVLDARYFLWLPAVLLLLLFWRTKGSPHQNRFVLCFLVGEAALLCLTLWALYLPILIADCAVS